MIDLLREQEKASFPSRESSSSGWEPAAVSFTLTATLQVEDGFGNQTNVTASWNGLQGPETRIGLLRSYNPVTGRFISKDPIEEQGGLNLYAFVRNNAVNFIDPFGLVDTPSSSITPWELGWEWLTGTGPRHRDFKDGDHFAELLRKHGHIKDEIKKAKDEIERRCASNCDNSDYTVPEKQGSYRLGGIQGVGKYLQDYSTLLTGGNTGNLAVTFLGSYRMRIEVTKISCCNGMAHMKAIINNSSTASSGSRPPVIGYTDWWLNNVAPIIDRLFSQGMGSPTTQKIELNEDVTFKKSNCPN